MAAESPNRFRQVRGHGPSHPPGRQLFDVAGNAVARTGAAAVGAPPVGVNLKS